MLTFNEYVLKLDELYKTLISSQPVNTLNLPSELPKRGIYLFSEKENHLYVGRSRNIRRRIQNHCRLRANHNQATFAFQIAREETNFTKATYKTEGSRAYIEKDPIFNSAFIKAKERIRKMELRLVEVDDPIQQALLEIFVALTLRTPYNDFDTH